MDDLIELDSELEILEKWSSDNYLVDLPQKWDISFAYLFNSKIVGYLICSKKEHHFHIHRLAVSKAHHNMHVAYNLLEHFFYAIGTNKIIKLKVKKINKNGIDFYQYLGFELYGEEDSHYLCRKVVV